MDLDDRFWSKVEKTNSCWNWTAYKHTKISKNEKEAPKVKSMFSPVKDDDPHIPEQEEVEE